MSNAIKPSKRTVIFKMLARKVSVRDIAELCKVGVGTVQRFNQRRKDAMQRERAIKGVPVTARRSARLEHQRTVAPYKCVCGFRVTVTPCVICAAKAGRERTAVIREDRR